MLRIVGRGVIGAFKRLLMKIPGMRNLHPTAVGLAVDEAWKRLLAQFLTDQGFQEGLDFKIPAPNEPCSDFLVSNDIANQRLQEILKGTVVAVKSHVRNGKIIRAHFRRIA